MHQFNVYSNLYVLMSFFHSLLQIPENLNVDDQDKLCSRPVPMQQPHTQNNLDGAEVQKQQENNKQTFELKLTRSTCLLKVEEKDRISQ